MSLFLAFTVFVVVMLLAPVVWSLGIALVSFVEKRKHDK